MALRKPDRSNGGWEQDVSDAEWEGDVRSLAADSGYRVVAGGRNDLPAESELREAARALGLSGNALDRRVTEVMHRTRRRHN